MDIFWIALQFIVLGISLAAPVGPINLEIIKRGISSGFYSSWLVGIGGMTADCLFLLGILVGLGPFLQLELVQISMYGIGSSLLLYLGITTIYVNLKKKRILDFGQPVGNNSFFIGFAIAAFNPINFVFWFGIFGSALQSLAIKGWYVALVGSLSILLGIFLWNLNMAFTVHFARAFIKEKILRSINLIAGVLLIAAAIPFFLNFMDLVL
ncbi:LysE type translocator [Bacillus sp. THAF10]|uniref:LysE family translocator n=1 Tax=Bacillus sp. THAF10 TaxID=2587848 RepID=UPI0012A7B342|nr:LysE family transporter [Bacillus sp. THAF10]QFT89542.1 LysE type translocator [Bacillus sp. THAF10]